MGEELQFKTSRHTDPHRAEACLNRFNETLVEADYSLAYCSKESDLRIARQASEDPIRGKDHS